VVVVVVVVVVATDVSRILCFFLIHILVPVRIRVHRRRLLLVSSSFTTTMILLSACLVSWL